MKWRGGGGSVFFVAVFGQIRALKSSISLSWKMRIYLVSDIFDRVWISRFFKKKISYRYLCSSKILKENLVWKRIILEILNVQFIIIYYNLITRVYIYTFVAECKNSLQPLFIAKGYNFISKNINNLQSVNFQIFFKEKKNDRKVFHYIFYSILLFYYYYYYF